MHRETYRRLWQELNPNEEQGGGYKLQAQGKLPTLMAIEVLAAIAYPVSDDEAYTDHLLRQADNESTNFRWRNLRLRTY